MKKIVLLFVAFVAIASTMAQKVEVRHLKGAASANQAIFNEWVLIVIPNAAVRQEKTESADSLVYTENSRRAEKILARIIIHGASLPDADIIRAWQHPGATLHVFQNLWGEEDDAWLCFASKIITKADMLSYNCSASPDDQRLDVSPVKIHKEKMKTRWRVVIIMTLLASLSLYTAFKIATVKVTDGSFVKLLLSWVFYFIISLALCTPYKLAICVCFFVGMVPFMSSVIYLASKTKKEAAQKAG